MHYPQFPAHFIFGSATAAYQMDGASCADGKGPSIWDKFPHTKWKIRFGHSGDVACDDYHRYSDDVAIMQELGLNAYRFLISWPRIFLQGEGLINQRGFDFYGRLIDELLRHDIAPFVTCSMGARAATIWKGMCGRSWQS